MRHRSSCGGAKPVGEAPKGEAPRPHGRALDLPPSESLSGAVIDEAFRAHGLNRPRTAIIAQTVPVRNALLGSGQFLSMVPQSVLNFRPAILV